MLINGIDISTFGAFLSDKQIQSSAIIINSNWNIKALDYFVASIQQQFKAIKLTINFIATDEETVLNNISNFYVQLANRCTIQFDGMDFIYSCIYDNTSNKTSDSTKYTNENYEVVINLLSGYAYKPPVTTTLNNVSSQTINVNGNVPTPTIVTVTVPIDTISITISGLSLDPIVINNLKANTPVVIDGEQCVATQNGVNNFSNVDMWEFPTLQPGANTISASSANCVIQIQYKPRWI